MGWLWDSWNSDPIVRRNRLNNSTKVISMNANILTSIAIAGLLALGGCATSPTNAQIGTGAGAVLGGVAGNALFGNTVGTVGGAAAGALIGNEVGKRK